MPIINIQGLNKAEVAFALYKNVDKKSQEALATRTQFLGWQTDVPGLYSDMLMYQVQMELDRVKGGRIDYLGCVKFAIDFSSGIINTDYYDSIHIPGINGVETSTAVIEKLRLEKEKRDTEDVADVDHVPPASNDLKAGMLKFREDKELAATQLSKADKKLALLFGVPVHISHLYSDLYVIHIDPTPSLEVLKAYAEKLVAAGIKAEVSSSSLISSPFEFRGSLEAILAIPIGGNQKEISEPTPLSSTIPKSIESPPEQRSFLNKIKDWLSRAWNTLHMLVRKTWIALKNKLSSASKQTRTSNNDQAKLVLPSNEIIQAPSLSKEKVESPVSTIPSITPSAPAAPISVSNTPPPSLVVPLIVQSHIADKSTPLLPAGLFQEYCALDKAQKTNIIETYIKTNGGICDFDNTIIARSALQALTSLDLPREKMMGITVGPDYGKSQWSLADQLKTKLIPSDYSQKDYIFFSIPTGVGTHSVPAVICKATKKIVCIDSMASTYLDEACTQLRSAIRDIKELEGYTLVTPPKKYAAQQTQSWACGVHSAANIVGIVLNEEIQQGRRPDLRKQNVNVPGYSFLAETVIDVASGTGIKRQEKTPTLDYFGIFILAFNRYTQDHDKRQVPLRLLKNQYRDVARMIEKWAATPSHPGYQFSQQLNQAAKEVHAVHSAINEGRSPLTTNRPLSEFVRDFTAKNPNDPINTLLGDPRFLATIPDQGSIVEIPSGKTLIQLEKELTQSVEQNVKHLKILLETFSVTPTPTGRSSYSP